MHHPFYNPTDEALFQQGRLAWLVLCGLWASLMLYWRRPVYHDIGRK